MEKRPIYHLFTDASDKTLKYDFTILRDVSGSLLPCHVDGGDGLQIWSVAANV
jgi:hypothetical protein